MANSGSGFGLLAGVGRMGNVSSGPISSTLIKTDLGKAAAQARLGYDMPYVWLIVFTGATALLAGWRFALKCRPWPP